MTIDHMVPNFSIEDRSFVNCRWQRVFHHMYGPPARGKEEANSAKDKPTGMFAKDTRIQPHVADTGPPLVYAMGIAPAHAKDHKCILSHSERAQCQCQHRSVSDTRCML